MDQRTVNIGAVAFLLLLFLIWHRSAPSEEKRTSTIAYENRIHLASSFNVENDELPPLPAKICEGWCPPKLSALDRIVRNIDCNARSIQDHVRASMQLENCPSAVQSDENARMVEQKLYKLEENDAFVFFRGAAGYFDIDLMCMDPNFQGKKRTMPRVFSNGDAHPENFGTQVMVNGGLVWGVNDFDQSFATPFSWDLKRGATGTQVACRAQGWNDIVCRASVNAFVEAYIKLASAKNVSSIRISNQDRFVEGELIP